jgi:hypothetical protein
LGPRVTFTASVKALTPLIVFSLAALSYLISFALMNYSLLVVEDDSLELT